MEGRREEEPSFELTSTSSEKKKSIELREEQGGGLMDSDEHRLSCVGELPQESEDVERRLTVESRGRFVEEEQDRFGDQL